MLSTAELTIIDLLITERELTVPEAVAATDYSQAHLYDVFDRLVESGLLIERRAANNQRHVQATAHPVVEAYRTLQAELGHVEWTDLLSPATLRVCCFLDKPRRIAAIARRLDITRQGVHKALSPLKNRAMLSPSGPKYALSDELSPLVSFAQAVVRHTHRNRIRTIAPSATITWCDPSRALVGVQSAEDRESLTDAPDWRLTGLARFESYGLRFFLAGEPAFWFGPNQELTPAEVVCHTLLLDSGSRCVSYAMLLIEKQAIDHRALTETAQWYGLETAISTLCRALEDGVANSEGTSVYLPSESAYAELKRKYGVS